MLTATERDALLGDRDLALANLDHGDCDAFIALYHRTTERVRVRLDGIRAQALQAHDATDYDDAAQLCVALSYAFHQRRRAHLGIQEVEPGQGQHTRTAIVYPLPDILAAVGRGDVAAIEVAAMGVDSATGEELRSADLRLHPEAERALAAQHGTPESAELGLGLRRALPDETVDELTRRLSSDPSTPTRAEVAELLSAVARYNDGHTPPMLVSTAS